MALILLLSCASWTLDLLKEDTLQYRSYLFFFFFPSWSVSKVITADASTIALINKRRRMEEEEEDDRQQEMLLDASCSASSDKEKHI